MTVAIIGIITTFALGALYAARERARHARTQAVIAKLDRQIAYRWDSYATRRLPIDPTAGVDLTLEAAPADIAAATDEEEIHELIRGTAAGIVAQRVVRARNELMRIELPDRYKDLFFEPQYLTTGTPVYPAVRDTYLRRIAAAIGVDDPSELNDVTTIDPDIWEKIFGENGLRRFNQSAEMLYLIVTTAAGGDSAPAARFKQSEVGDTDGDGMPEFLDGWGRPIEFFRWAPGFRSDRQTGEAHHDPNPFDPLHVDEPWPDDPETYTEDDMGFRLYPLVVSAGADGQFGLYFLHNVLTTDPILAKDSFPYALYGDDDDDGDRYQRGAPMQLAPTDTRIGTGHLDNVHNHALGAR